MARRSAVFIVLILSLCLTACSISLGKSSGAKVNIGESEKFSKEEITAAVNCVKETFRGFSGCEMTSISYDEQKSDEQAKGYISGGEGSENGASEGNVIVLFSDFTVDASGGEGLNPNSTYTGWKWVLTRDSAAGKWRVDSRACGLG